MKRTKVSPRSTKSGSQIGSCRNALPARYGSRSHVAVQRLTSDADEDAERVVQIQLAASSRVGRSNSVADALCRLEFDVARHQDRIARFAADFVRWDSFRYRNCRSFAGLDRTGVAIATAALRLRPAGFYRRVDVRRQLRAAFLGRATCFVRSGGSVAGHHPDLWNGIRACDASGRTDASAETGGLAARTGRSSDNLRAASWLQWADGILGRTRHCVRSCGRSVF